jgi:hypothetical protein
MQPASQAPMESHAGDLLIVGIAFLIIGIIYILPGFVAFRREHPNRWLILVINLAFGGTIIGWGVALAWALRVAHRPGSTSSGGESGLNLFINDVRKIQVVDPPPLPQISPAQEIERLHDLLIKGAISRTEFDGLKAKLLGGAPSP